MIKKLLLAFIVLLVVIQFIPIDKAVKPVNPQEDFVQVLDTPEPIRVLLRNACYDCHSNETVYPGYSRWAPISWIIQNHVVEGRERLNFSTWTRMNPDQQAHAMQEAAETVESGEMPHLSYPPMHPKARLTDAERQALVQYFLKISAKETKNL